MCIDHRSSHNRYRRSHYRSSQRSDAVSSARAHDTTTRAAETIRVASSLCIGRRSTTTTTSTCRQDASRGRDLLSALPPSARAAHAFAPAEARRSGGGASDGEVASRGCSSSPSHSPKGCGGGAASASPSASRPALQRGHLGSSSACFAHAPSAHHLLYAVSICTLLFLHAGCRAIRPCTQSRAQCRTCSPHLRAGSSL